MDTEEMLRQQRAELERIRAKRQKKSFLPKKTTLRKLLNIIFLLLGLAGLGLYYLSPENKAMGLNIILGAMGIKIVELLIRYLG